MEAIAALIFVFALLAMLAQAGTLAVRGVRALWQRGKVQGWFVRPADSPYKGMGPIAAARAVIEAKKAEAISVDEKRCRTVERSQGKTPVENASSF